MTMPSVFSQLASFGVLLFIAFGDQRRTTLFQLHLQRPSGLEVITQPQVLTHAAQFF